MQTDDAIIDSKETATAFNLMLVKLAIAREKKLLFANPQIKIQKNVTIEAVIFRRIATVSLVRLCLENKYEYCANGQTHSIDVYFMCLTFI